MLCIITTESYVVPYEYAMCKNNETRENTVASNFT